MINPNFVSHSFRTLIAQLPSDSMELLGDCLLALPCLKTLGITDNRANVTGKALNAVFRNQLDFPNITKVAIPMSVHRILRRLPGVEEIICFRDDKDRLSVPVVTSFRKPGSSALKSFTVISPSPERELAAGV